MGPTTAALLRFFQADQAYVDARQKLQAATHNVRAQQDKVAKLQADHDAAHTSATSLEAKAREIEGDLKSREARIELLRERQNTATNPKEYQALIVEINTQKLDKSKLEEQALGQLEKAETEKKNVADFKAKLDAETAKHTQMAGEIDARVKELSGQVETLKGPRDELLNALPVGARHAYERAAERYDGEAMSPIEKPDPRDQEYLCTGCNTYLVADIYNRLRSSKDEIVTCPSCMRILYIPEEMTDEIGLSKKAVRGDKPKKAPGEKKPRAPRAKKVKGEPAAVANAEPGSIAAALVEGAAASRGKGAQDKSKPMAAPLPTTHAGVVEHVGIIETPDMPVNVETQDDAGAVDTIASATDSSGPAESTNPAEPSGTTTA